MDGPFGAGWTMDGLDWATITEDAVSVGTGDGNRLWFKKEGDDYIAQAGDPFNMSLVENLDGSFTLTDKNGNESNFDEDGLLTSRVDLNGRETTYAYIDADSDSAVDDIDTITDPAGREISFGYTGGLVTSVTDFAGRVTTLDYDGSDRLDTITLEDPDDGGPLSAPETTLTYNGSGQIASLATPEGQTTSFTYGDHGDLASSTASSITTDYCALSQNLVR